MQHLQLILIACSCLVYGSGAANAQTPVRQGVPSAVQAPAQQANGVFLNNNAFDIPFSIERTGAQPVEVQLFVSRDQGQSWKFFARQPANETGFPFEANEDGGFWFATRTIDARGVSYPTGPMSPQLQVFVDTKNPKIDAKADTNASGQIQFDYEILDASADPTQLRLEYMTDAVRQWMPIAIQGQPGIRPNDGAYVGRITWQPQTQWRHLYVRMIVRDKAGNQTTINKQVEKPRVAGNPMNFAGARTGPGVPAQTVSNRPTFGNAQPSHPIPPQPMMHPGVPANQTPHVQQQPAAQYSQVASNGQAYPRGAVHVPPNQQMNVAPASVPVQMPQSPQGQVQMPVQYPTSNGLAQPQQLPTTQQYPAQQRPLAQQHPVAQPQATYHQPGMVPSYRGAQPLVAQPTAGALGLNAPLQSGAPAPQPASSMSVMPTQGNQSSVLNSSQPAVSQQPVSPSQAFRPLDAQPRSVAPEPQEPKKTAPTASNSRQLTLNDTPRVTRAKQFSLDYEVDSIGNGGVQAVELWGTRDGGQTWRRWNADPDKQSPFDIEVSKEGLIGFRIVVVAANGLTTPRPQEGEPADIYILVDTTAPRARITGANYGQGQQAGSLVIDYACNDENFGDRPISLAFSDKADGEWTTIATGLSNNGRYVWPADPQLPREIYLRVEATDKAGNIGIHALDVPISAQGLSPQGRIRGFQPIDGPEAQQAAVPSPVAPQARFR